MSEHRNERLEALGKDLEAGVKALVTSERWLAWLAFASRFHTYSFNNQMLILLQCPEATHVTGYNTWKALGRQVRKGSKSIGIYAPMLRKVKDEVTGDEVRRVVGFRIVSVFDVSQTDGEPLPEPVRASLLEGEAPTGLWDALAAIVAGNSYKLERGDCGGANGWTNPSIRTIRVRDDVDAAQAVKTLVHEVAHMQLHTDDTGDALNVGHRGVAEVEAESVAYIVGNYYGVATEAYSLPYIAGWSDGDVDVITATAQRVAKTARAIIEAVDATMGAAPVPETVAA